MHVAPAALSAQHGNLKLRMTDRLTQLNPLRSDDSISEIKSMNDLARFGACKPGQHVDHTSAGCRREQSLDFSHSQTHSGQSGAPPWAAKYRPSALKARPTHSCTRHQLPPSRLQAQQLSQYGELRLVSLRLACPTTGH